MHIGHHWYSGVLNKHSPFIVSCLSKQKHIPALSLPPSFETPIVCDDMIFFSLRLNMKALTITSSHRSIIATTQRKLPFGHIHRLSKCYPQWIPPEPASLVAANSFFQRVCQSTNGSYFLYWNRTRKRKWLSGGEVSNSGFSQCQIPICLWFFFWHQWKTKMLFSCLPIHNTSPLYSADFENQGYVLEVPFHKLQDVKDHTVHSYCSLWIIEMIEHNHTTDLLKALGFALWISALSIFCG